MCCTMYNVQWDNLWKSRGGIVVNGAPREVLNGVPRKYIEGPPRDFLKTNPRPHSRPDPRPKILGSGRGCGRGFARRKSRGGFNILPRKSIEKLLRGSIHHYIPKAFPQIVILSRSRRNQVKQNKQTNNIKKTANGGP